MSGMDYKAYATREAAAVLDECSVADFSGVSRDLILSLMAACWMQGAIFGSHETLALIESDFQKARAEL